MAREGVPLNVIQRQLGHANLGITSVYLQGIDNSEIIETVGARRRRPSRRAQASTDGRRAKRGVSVQLSLGIGKAALSAGRIRECRCQAKAAGLLRPVTYS